MNRDNPARDFRGVGEIAIDGRSKSKMIGKIVEFAQLEKQGDKHGRIDHESLVTRLSK